MWIDNLIVICILLTIIIIFGGIDRQIPNKPNEGFNDSETIFVSIPSYRDIDCKNTLQNLFSNAKYPELIYVGVFQQNDINNSEEQCSVDEKYQNNVRYKTVSYTEAKGPFYARAVINNHLYQGEKYYLMIDAHSIFLNNWDERMKNQLNYLREHGVSKPIISSYPHHLDFKKTREIDNQKRDVTTLICDITRAKGYPTEAIAQEKPSGNFYRGYLLGAGYIFTYGEFFREISLDETLEHIFGGEEIMLAVLAYTHGWDIYSPAYMNIFHYYNHQKPSWFSDNNKGNEFSDVEKKSYDKLDSLINTDINQDCMGKSRNISDFWKELGFYRDKTEMSEKYPATSKELRCNKTPFIPYPVIESFHNRETI